MSYYLFFVCSERYSTNVIYYIYPIMNEERMMHREMFVTFYISIYRVIQSNSYRKIRKWNQFGLKVDYSSPCLFHGEHNKEKSNPKAQTNKHWCISNIDVEIWLEIHSFKWTKSYKNDSQQETTQTTYKKIQGCFYSVLCTNKLIWLSKLYLKSYIQLLLHNHIIHYQKFMKTYLQINESKSSSKLSVVTHSVASLEQRPCNYTIQKAFPEGCATKSIQNSWDMAVGSTHMHNVNNTPLEVYFIWCKNAGCILGLEHVNTVGYI